VLALAPPTLGRRLVAGVIAIAATSFSVLAFVAAIRSLEPLLSGDTLSWPERVGPFIFLAGGVASLALAWSLRVRFLPFQLCIDADQRAARLIWRRLQAHTVLLDGLSAIVVTPAFADRFWAYAILAATSEGRQFLCRSDTTYQTEHEASTAGRIAGEQIARHLSVPLEFEDWTISINNSERGSPVA
jgi:hypothetical protein